MQALLDRRDQYIRLVEQSHRIKVENQIVRTGSPDADRVHPGSRRQKRSLNTIGCRGAVNARSRGPGVCKCPPCPSG